MFNVAFFTDFLSRPFLAEKLRKFLGADAPAWLRAGGGERPARSAEDLPLPADNYAYRAPWLLRGEESGGAEADGAEGHAPPEPALYAPASYDGLDRLLRGLAVSYSWALVPWGGTEEFMSLAFVTRERALLERFVDCSENSVEPFKAYAGALGPSVAARRYGTLISSYAVASGLEDVCRACLFQEEWEAAGRGVWEVCGFDRQRPRVVYGAPALAHEGPPADGLESLGPLTSARGMDFRLYSPSDERGFADLCRLAGDAAVLVLPGTAGPGEAIRLVELFEGEGHFSDLVHVGDALDSCEWFYAPGRGHADERYSLFAARETGLVSSLGRRGAGDARPFQLISCF